MKIERLIGIITMLSRHEKLTTPYLAQKFEVSRRTINRDIEAICRAGIPVASQQGRDGGVWIMEGFKLDSTVFTKDELESVLAGLRSVGSVSKSGKAMQIANKISCGKGCEFPSNMLIDLSSFYIDSLSEKIEQIKADITNQRFIKFTYFYNKGEAEKRVEPYLIVYKWSDWYLFGYCTEKQDYRLYKLNRLWNLKTDEGNFEKRTIPPEKLNFGANITDKFFVTAVYDESLKFRLVEEYGPKSFTPLPNGTLRAKTGFNDESAALIWFLSMGDKVTISSPKGLQEKIKQQAMLIFNKY